MGNRSSNHSSAEASRACSGAASPMAVAFGAAGGQLSPWLLEAEALVNEPEEELIDPIFVGKMLPRQDAAWGFAPTGTRGVWMPGIVAARKPRGVYLIDKQGKGIYGKVKTCDLISEAEQRKDPGLRAFAAFDDEHGTAEKPSTPASKKKVSTRKETESETEDLVSLASMVKLGDGKAANGKTSSVAMKSASPRLSEEPGKKRQGGGKAPRTHAGPTASTQPPAQLEDPSKKRVTALASRFDSGKSPTANGVAPALPRAGAAAMKSAASSGGDVRQPARVGQPFPARPTTPPSVKGRIVRDDFSDDSDDGW